MANEYSYPLSIDWTTEEMVAVVKFFEVIELAYEKGVTSQQVMERYKPFKEVVRSIAEEKTSFREFADVSGYDAYPVVKAAKAGEPRIKMATKN
ncbi:hypothetical protein CF394_01705 [Tetzosporium hominis]|uniref:Uncharacterized protein n=1 Tax=Tetzosporium hominis TaxID=2020506 RepID=A0A264W6L2_9BACL|nr:UPF0223 family protein [Tetzosporium hominis]OZS79161.1 hypothetical protein CF394_01705 [Tetzosporium hominis]